MLQPYDIRERKDENDRVSEEISSKTIFTQMVNTWAMGDCIESMGNLAWTMKFGGD